MTPSYAEVARTLIQGRLPGLLRVGEKPAGFRPVRHADDGTGRPLVLLADGDRETPGADARPPGELAVDDVPPVAGAPSLGRVRLRGRLRRLAPAEGAVAVHEFAAVNPAAELLDVGRGQSLYAIDVDGVCLEQGVDPRPDPPPERPAATVRDVDLARYAAARPDPLHELERDLLLDLAHHHGQMVGSYFRFLLAVAGIPCCRTPRAVRLDRYGFVVEVGGSQRWVRLDFHRPVHCRHELAHALRPVLFRAR